MSFHKNDTPEMKEALRLYGLESDEPSQLSDAFRSGFGYARRTPPAQALEVDALAAFIREIDGRHSMGAGALAEHICERFSTPPAQGVAALPNEEAARRHAWQQMKADLQPDKWTVGESANYSSFFFSGWSAARCYAQHVATTTPTPPAVPEGWQGWRDVAVHGFPEKAQEVLFVLNGKTVHGAFINDIFWHSNEKHAAALWMPLPDPIEPDEHRRLLAAAPAAPVATQGEAPKTVSGFYAQALKELHAEGVRSTQTTIRQRAEQLYAAAQPAGREAEAVVLKSVFCVSNKTASMYFRDRENADRAASSAGATAGMLVTEIPLLDGATAPPAVAVSGEELRAVPDSVFDEWAAQNQIGRISGHLSDQHDIFENAVQRARTLAARPAGDAVAVIIRDICETDAADPDAMDTVCISVDDLRDALVRAQGGAV